MLEGGEAEPEGGVEEGPVERDGEENLKRGEGEASVHEVTVTWAPRGDHKRSITSTTFITTPQN